MGKQIEVKLSKVKMRELEEAIAKRLDMSGEDVTIKLFKGAMGVSVKGKDQDDEVVGAVVADVLRAFEKDIFEQSGIKEADVKIKSARETNTLKELAEMARETVIKETITTVKEYLEARIKEDKRLLDLLSQAQMIIDVEKEINE